MSTKNIMQGFTLIEVLVALTIFTVAAAAASSASMSYIKTTDNLRTKTLAHFVAKNRMADIIINNEWSTQSQQTKQLQENGGTWQVVQNNRKNNNPDIINVEMSVFVKSDAGQSQNSVTDYAFVLSNPTVKSQANNQAGGYVFE